MKTIAISSFFVLFALAAGIVATTPAAFADHSEVTVEAAMGSGVPGCEETAEGCYIPSTATVDVGGVVIFSNPDTVAHTFTSGNAADEASVGAVFDSGLVMAGGSYEWFPDTVGEYEYFCIVHPWMIGEIIVKSSGGSSYIPPPTSSGTDWQSKYLEVLSDFNEVSAKVGDLQKENSELRSQITEMQATIDNLNAIILEQVKVIYDWVLGN